LLRVHATFVERASQYFKIRSVRLDIVSSEFDISVFETLQMQKRTVDVP